MAPPTLQLFPPPPSSQRKPVQQWPARTTSRKTQAKVSVPAPTTERRDSGKSPVDFHELVIRVDSAPSSPVALSTQPGAVSVPKQAHIVSPRTPSQQTNAIPAPQLPPRAPSVSSYAQTARPRIVTIPASPTRIPIGTAVSPEGKVAVSPTGRSVFSPISTISSHPAGSTPSPASPPRQRVVSPSISDPRSGSPTLVRSNSGATGRSLPSPPPMRSMFPQYNPNLPLDQQTYKPTQASPTHIPMSKISRPLYSPSNYTPHAYLESERQSNAPVATPYYTPSSMLDSLWDVTNGQGTPVVQTFTLQMHKHPASSIQSNEPQLSFGPTPSLPFYSLSHTDIPPGPGEEEDDDEEHELLIRRHHPTKPTNVPITHLKLSPTPTSSPTGAAKNLDPASVITTIYPKIAALTALDVASNSPAASHIAAFDPDATSAAAQRLAEDVLRKTAERECCALVWTRGQQNLPAQHSSSSSGTYALHHPTLGLFHITHEGDTSPGLSPVLGSLPFSQRNGGRNSPIKRGNNKPTVITIANPMANPQEQSEGSSSDSVLAKLDFGAESLVLNVAALLKFNNTYLIDVLVSTLLAVALAEEKRLRREVRFAAPPSGPGMPYSFSTVPGLCAADEAKIKRKRLFKFMRTKTGIKEIPACMYKTTPGTDNSQPGNKTEPESLELREIGSKLKELGGSFTALPQFAGPKDKAAKEKSDLPFVTRTLVSVLSLGFKTVVWVLGITIKIVAGVVVKVTSFVVARAK